MMYAIINPDGTIVRYQSHESTMGKGWRCLPVTDTDPPYDSETEVRTGPVVTVTETAVERVWTVTAKSAADVAEARKDAVRDLRTEKINGGMTINGFPVRTDPDSLTKINGAIKLLETEAALKAADPEYDAREAIDWEGVPGVWATLDLTQMQGVGLAVGLFIQACFTRSKALIDAIDAAAAEDGATAADVLAIDIEADWPSGT